MISVLLKISENTLIVLTSDNGPVVDDGYQDRAVELLGNHSPGVTSVEVSIVISKRGQEFLFL